MSGRQLLRLVVAFAVLLVLWAAVALARRQENTLPAGNSFRLPSIPRSTVDTVLLARVADTVILARKDRNAWTVNGQPAAPQAIGDLFAVLTDTTRESELVAERRISQAGMGVDSASGTRVQIKGKGRMLADLVAGNRSADFSGGYLRRADQEPTYLVRGNLVEILTRKGDEWRDHRIAAVSGDSVGSIEVTRGAKRYALRRNAKAWTLSSGSTADSAQVTSLLSAYRSVEASGFATPAQTDSAHFASPDRRVRLLRKNGTPLLTLVFDSTSAGFWIRPDTGKTVYRIESWAADRLAPPDTSFHRATRAKSPS
jgi:hypothetical protein